MCAAESKIYCTRHAHIINTNRIRFHRRERQRKNETDIGLDKWITTNTKYGRIIFNRVRSARTIQSITFIWPIKDEKRYGRQRHVYLHSTFDTNALLPPAIGQQPPLAAVHRISDIIPFEVARTALHELIIIITFVVWLDQLVSLKIEKRCYLIQCIQSAGN